MQLLKKILSITLSIIFVLFSVFSIPVTAKANTENFNDIELDYSIILKRASDEGEEEFFSYNVKIQREDFIAVKFCKTERTLSDGRKNLKMFGYIFSKKPFKILRTSKRIYKGVEQQLLSDTEWKLQTEQTYNNIYYCSIDGINTTIGKDDDYEFNVYDYDDFPYDMTYDEIRDYIAKDLDIARDEFEDINIDENGSYDPNIPRPDIVAKKDSSGNFGLDFAFDNATDEYYIEMEGRWRSIDDIEMFKENLMWKYKYSTVLKGDLTKWVTYESSTKGNLNNYNFGKIGEKSWNEFIKTYPVDNRSFTGGTNAIGNFLSGYNDAVNTLKMLLDFNGSLFNGVEIYVRYYKICDNGEIKYGKWTHYLNSMANEKGSSGSRADDEDNMNSGSESDEGLTDEEKEENEKRPDPSKDPDLKYDDYTMDFKFPNISDLILEFYNAISSAISTINQVPALFNKIFSFLPVEIIALIGVGFTLALILRFFGR